MMAAKNLTDLKGRRFTLLTEELYKSLKDREKTVNLTDSPEFSRIKSLEDELNNVLKNQTLDPERKAQMYALLLRKFQSLKSKAPETGNLNREEKYPTTVLMSETKNLPAATEPKTPAQHVAVRAEERAALTPPQDQLQLRPVMLKQSPLEDEGEAEARALAEEEAAAAARAKAEEEEARLYDTENIENPIVASASAAPSPIKFDKMITNKERLDNAREIFDEIKRNPDKFVMDFDPETRAMSFFGHRRPLTSVDEILNYVTKKRLPEIKPHGVMQFLESYGQGNFPLHLIRNKKLRAIAQAASQVSGKGRVKKRKMVKTIKWSKW